MEKRRLGKNGPWVSELGFGAMGMSFSCGPAEPEAPMIGLLHEAPDPGIILFNTAGCYGPYANEVLLGRAFRGQKDRIVLATKCGIQISPEGRQTLDARPETIRASVEGSLRRLQTDRIGLYYLHRVDPKGPVEDVAGVMKDQIAEKILHWGLSEACPKTVARVQEVCPLTALQSEYSMMWREPEERTFPSLEAGGIGFVSFSPPGKGFLTGKITTGTVFGNGDHRRSVPRFDQENIEANMRLVRLIESVAEEKGATPAQVCDG